VQQSAFWLHPEIWSRQAPHSTQAAPPSGPEPQAPLQQSFESRQSAPFATQPYTAGSVHVPPAPASQPLQNWVQQSMSPKQLVPVAPHVGPESGTGAQNAPVDAFPTQFPEQQSVS
jgi:hypothetical protein